MKKVIVLVFGLICLWGSNAFSSDSLKNEPTGFRSKDWGSDFKKFSGMKLREDDGDTRWYSKKRDNLKIGEADLNGIIYGFYKDAFFYVLIDFNKLENFTRIKDTLTQLYGDGYQDNKYLEQYGWFGSNVYIVLKYSQTEDSGTLVYQYQPIMEKKKADEKAKAKAGAGDL
jgi:hypothetical protein